MYILCEIFQFWRPFAAFLYLFCTGGAGFTWCGLVCRMALYGFFLFLWTCGHSHSGSLDSTSAPNFKGSNSAENIAWLMEGQAFSPTFVFGSTPTPLPSSSCLSLTVCYRSSLLTGRGGGAISYDGEEAWSSLKYSILSGQTDPQFLYSLCLRH